MVLLAGAFDPFDEQEAQRVHADGVLKKPFVPPDPLINAVKALLAKSAGDRLMAVTVPVAAASGESSEEVPTDVQTGSVMTYFEEKGFGFLRPDGGGKDIFFHISRLHQGDATALVPGAKVAYDLGMDRNGKIAASSVRLLGVEEKPA